MANVRGMVRQQASVQAARRIYLRARNGPRRLPRLSDYAPRSTLALRESIRTRAVEPAIDAHNHLGRWLTRGGSWMEPDVEDLLRRMDACNVRAVVNLDGRWGSELAANIARYDKRFPDRFATFCHVDWTLCDRDRFDELPTLLTRCVEQGAKGLKVWKDLGRTVRDARGNLILPSDSRLTPLWRTAAEIGVPVLIHSADPVPYFQKPNRRNERLEELWRFPGVTWCKPGLPSHTTLMDSIAQMVASNPETTFIAAHMAGWSENLSWVGDLLDHNPNVFVDIAARVSDLGRQPRAASRFIEAHATRVLFGTDVFPFRPDELSVYFRFLETDDEAFAYSSNEPPPHGRWTISGLELSPDTLANVYRRNALGLLPALGERDSK